MDEMTDEEAAACALAVYARNQEQTARDRGEWTKDVGDHFPEEWVEVYRDLVRLSRESRNAYPDPEYRVHQMLSRVMTFR